MSGAAQFGQFRAEFVEKPRETTSRRLVGSSNISFAPVSLDDQIDRTVLQMQPPAIGKERDLRLPPHARRPGIDPCHGIGRISELSLSSLSEHQAGKLLDIADTGIKMKGRRSTPGRYFQVADPGTGWGGTNISDPLSILGPFDAKEARPGLTMLMVSTTGEHASYYVLDEALRPVATEMPAVLRHSVERIQENCEPALCTVLFMGGAGGSLRAGVTDNPVRLTRSVKDALTRVTSGGAPVYVWPGGGITFMVDVTQMPSGQT